VTKRTDRLLREIEQDALDEKKSMAAVLNKVIALGGRVDSTKLRDWARRELQGYTPEDELPEYRKIYAPLLMDAATMTGIIKGQQLSPWDLPDFAQKDISNDLIMPKGIGEIERLARSCPPGDAVKISPYMAAQLVQFMNMTGHWNGRIERIYWGVSPTILEGIVDQVRTRTIALISEIIADMPEGAVTPSRETADNAFELAVTGKQNKINVIAAQGGSTVPAPPPEESTAGWMKAAAWVFGAIIAIAAMIFTLMQVQGWHF
jgi:AbiTii